MNKSYLLFLPVIVALIVSYLYFQGPHLTFDDGSYILGAHELLNGTFSISSSPYMYGWLLPFTEAMAIVEGMPLWLPDLVSWLVIVACVTLIARKHFDAEIAALAALGVALTPAFFVYSTRVLPDPMIGALLALSMLILEYKPSHAILAGMLAGATVFIKLGGFLLPLLVLIAYPLGLIIASACLAYIFGPPYLRAELERRRFIAGVLLAVFLYQISILPLYAPALAVKYEVLQAQLSMAHLSTNLYELGILFGSGIIGYPQIFPLGALFMFAILGTALALQRKRVLLPYAIFLWSGVAYLTLGTLSLTSYVPISVVDRYYIVFAVPAALLAAEPLMVINKKYGTAITYVVFLLLMLITNFNSYYFFFSR